MAKKNVHTLNVKNLAIAAGLTWALGVLSLGVMWAVGFLGMGLDIIASWYRGFAPTIGGVIIGAIWAFIDAAIGVAVFACIYNWLQKR